jgi:hypothetical protein
MAYSSLTFEIKDGVGLIRLNRPNDGNAITLLSHPVRFNTGTRTRSGFS